MRKTILTLAMMLMMALASIAAPATPAVPAVPSAANVAALKTDSVNEAVQNVKEKINDALDDTITTSNGIHISDSEELSPEDLKYMSDHWGEIVKNIAYASIAGLLGLVLLILFFRFLNRRNKYRVIERAIENHYPLESLPLGDVNRSAVYVQQPVVAAPQPPFNPAAQQQTGRATVGTPIGAAPNAAPMVMTGMVNWRALMPAVKWIGWGLAFFLFGICIDLENPFWPVGLALIFVGICKGFILYNEQKALQQALQRSQEMQRQEPMRTGVPVPPPMNYTDDDSVND